MEEIYWGLFLTLMGGAISTIKDWKNKKEKIYIKENTIAVIGFLLVLVGSIKSCSFGSSAIASKNISDSLSKVANAENKNLLMRIDTLEKMQMDSLKSSLSKSMDIIKLEEQNIKTNKKISSLQDQLLSYTIGFDSYPYIQVGFYQKPNSSEVAKTEIWLEKRGNDPLYDITVSFQDLWQNTQHFQDFLKGNYFPKDNDFYVGNLFGKVSTPVFSYNLGPNQKIIVLQFWITARNRHFNQLFKCINVNETNRKIATQLKDENGKILAEDVSPNFPRKKDGTIDWDPR